MKRGVLLFLLLAFVSASFAQQAATSSTSYAQSGTPAIAEKQQASSLAAEERAQRSIDRAINILKLVATFISILAGLIALVVGMGGAAGFYQFRRWQEIQKGVEERARKLGAQIEKLQPLLLKAEKDIKAIEQHRKKADDLAAQTPIPYLTEKPSPEIMKKLDELARELERVEAFGSTLTAADYFSRAADLYYKGKYELALEASDRGIELRPGDAQAWANKGEVLRRLGRYEEALEAADRAVELKPDFADGWFNKGQALSGLRRHTEALEAYEKGLELKSDDAQAWNNKGWVLLNLGHHEEGLQALDKAVELKPDYALARYNRACALSLLKRKPETLSDLKRAIELDDSLKLKARKDEAFRNLWDDEEFKKIVA